MTTLKLSGKMKEVSIAKEPQHMDKRIVLTIDNLASHERMELIEEIDSMHGDGDVPSVFAVQCSTCDTLLPLEQANLEWDVLYGTRWAPVGARCLDCGHATVYVHSYQAKPRVGPPKH